MTDPKEKPRREIKVREPKKAKPDTFANLRPLPTAHPIDEILNLPATTHQSPPVTTTRQDSPPVERPIAPARDFNRKANSVDRDALPAGMFPNSTKKIYDALYIRSRGAIVPKRKVRASRRDFLEWTDIKNLKTIDTQLRLLMTARLIVREWKAGQTDGAVYEVFLPEEVLYPPVPTTPHQSVPEVTSQKMTGGYSQTSGSGGDSQTVDFQRASDDSKTNLRLKDHNDDDPLALFVAEFEQASRELTGRGLNPLDREKWAELARLLIGELKIGAARSQGVSCVPAFLTGCLIRRLSAKRSAEAKPVPETPILEPIQEATAEDIAEYERARAELSGGSA